MPNFGSGPSDSGHYSALPGDQTDNISLIPKSPPTAEFNPYMNAEHPRFPSYATTSYGYDEVPAFEEGYGGGSWSHHEIAEDEKPLPQQEEDLDNASAPSQRDVKTTAGPSAHPEVDPLPQYAPSESSELR